MTFEIVRLKMVFRDRYVPIRNVTYVPPVPELSNVQFKNIIYVINTFVKSIHKIFGVSNKCDCLVYGLDF